MEPKPTILIVEDEAGPRDALRMILRPFYNLVAVDRAGLAMQALRERRIDLVTLDLKLPDQQGIDLLQEIKLEYPDIEVIIITGYGSLKSAMDGIRYGASGYLLKPFNVTELIAVVNRTLTKRRRLTMLRECLGDVSTQWQTERDAAEAWRRLTQCHAGDSGGGEADTPDRMPFLSELLEAKSRALFTHCSRVSFYAGLIGKAVGLSSEELKTLTFGSFFHDIGLIALDLSDMEATDECRTEPRRHPELGGRMIMAFNLPAEIGQIITYHHEQYDGTGACGLQRDGIPLMARIVHLADAFDHLEAEMPAVGPREALEPITRQAGSTFDPGLVEMFEKVLTTGNAVMPPVAPTFPSAARR